MGQISQKAKTENPAAEDEQNSRAGRDERRRNPKLALTESTLSLSLSLSLVRDQKTLKRKEK
jgi:hypothetical protein